MKNTQIYSFEQQFNIHFLHLKNKRIVLYGIGQYTKKILDEVQGFQIVGLMDREKAGTMIYGKKVLSKKEAAEQADAIIIVANLSVSPKIYRRIQSWTGENQIEVYYLNGLKPQRYDTSIAGNVYWQTSWADLRKLIDENEVISFDIFDTLLLRKCVSPRAVFELLKKQENLADDFVEKRIEAEKLCYRNVTKFFTIEDIYQMLGQMCVIPQNERQALMHKEIALEEQMLIPRYEVIEFLKYSISVGKKVVLTSDMYLQREVIVNILKRCGINNYDKVFISCEEKCDKYWGNMWERVKSHYPDKQILHIGDNEISDVKTAIENEIAVYRIASTKELLKNSGLMEYFGELNVTGDTLLLGMPAKHLLDNPFALNEYKGRIYIRSMYDFGYVFCGPLILKYLLWIKESAIRQNVDTLLFVARDGYLLEKLYRKVTDENAPKAIYYLSSRRAASVAALETEDDIWFVFDKMCSTASVKYEQILKKAFGIIIPQEDELYGKTIYEVGKETMFKHTCQKYVYQIFQNAKQERKNYLKYVAGLPLSENVGFINFVGRGVTQYWTEKMLQRRMQGFYFAVEDEIIDIYDMLENIHSLYPDFQSTHTSMWNLIMNYLFGETILTSPTGTVMYFAEDGTPIYENVVNSKFDRIAECHSGIEKYVEEMIGLLKEWPFIDFSIEMVDKIFGLFRLENFILSDEIKTVFEFEDFYGER